MINRVRPFFDNKQDIPRKSPGLISRRVYLMNLPYDVIKKELEMLVKEFADIEDIAIPRDR